MIPEPRDLRTFSYLLSTFIYQPILICVNALHFEEDAKYEAHVRLLFTPVRIGSK